LFIGGAGNCGFIGCPIGAPIGFIGAPIGSIGGPIGAGKSIGASLVPIGTCSGAGPIGIGIGSIGWPLFVIGRCAGVGCPAPYGIAPGP
jgi:hypothetical protein